MANPNAKGKAAAHGSELAQRTRKAVLNTFDALEKKGKKISEILAEEFEKNPIKFMELASKLIPKEHVGTVNHLHDRVDSMSKQEINAELAEIKRLTGVLTAAKESAGTGPEEKAGKSSVH